MRTTYRRRPSTIMPSSPVCPRPFWGVWQARRWRTSTATRQNPLLRRHALRFQGACPPITDPADRMAFHAKATSEMWQPSKATKLFEHILAFLKEHLETGVCLLEASENGKQVIECFGKDTKVKMLHAFLGHNKKTTTGRSFRETL